MLQMRWVKYEEPAHDNTPTGAVLGWHGERNYFVLQFREVLEFDEWGDIKTASEWKTVEIEKDQ